MKRIVVVYADRATALCQPGETLERARFHHGVVGVAEVEIPDALPIPDDDRGRRLANVQRRISAGNARATDAIWLFEELMKHERGGP